MDNSRGVLGLYTDGPIGMDHPFFMARVEARQFALDAARRGLQLEATLEGARERVASLFGEVPQALVDGTATTAWLCIQSDDGGSDA